ncbi:Copper chaperone for superoxide dismutase [Hypsibius exemplaris]|uniref:Extracellular superoxide dismutase [Cu-Zn] n=1 Tax=Hypsibius exemplaris TaxID=2072580 RepID=A0A1W0X7W3_HYPEX|nr:Copper chaperone for superoxide dismutase [Hypsibius exemplaris]
MGNTGSMEGSPTISPTIASIEFAVKMSCKNCEAAVKKALGDVQGIDSVAVDLAKESVIVQTSLTSSVVQNLIEKSGKKAVLRGVGAPGTQLGAAVVEFYGMGGVKGVTRFVQLSENKCLIDGTIDGLSPGRHGFAVCESGDLSQGCESVGNHYNPTKADHSGPDSPTGHVGDLGNILADATGRASFRFENNKIKLLDLIGHAVAIHAGEDDGGKGTGGSSKIDGNAGPKLACGILARSAGIMENEKKICSCSGETLWDERDTAKSKFN